MRAVTAKGGVDVTQAFTVQAAGTWVTVAFFYYGADHYEPTPQNLSIRVLDSAPAFE